MNRQRGMSERQRVIYALQGRRFPHVGDRGLYTRRIAGIKLYGEIEVVRVSETGQTIWTRFLSRQAQAAFEDYRLTHRWWRVPDDDIGRDPAELLYRAGNDAKLAPVGEISFPSVIPEEAL